MNTFASYCTFTSYSVSGKLAASLQKHFQLIRIKAVLILFIKKFDIILLNCYWLIILFVAMYIYSKHAYCLDLAANVFNVD